MTPSERLDAIRLLHDLNGDLARTELSLTATTVAAEQAPLVAYATETNTLIGRLKELLASG